ncbi:IS5/IS1182 family transposase, partial [Brevibacillus borstelensis]|nr:IS5/IS1182 family transposase [Brevibacillus borstelensis]
QPQAVAVDSGYKTPYISKTLLDDQIRPVMPYTRPRTKEGFFKKHEYVYDEYFDCYICPNEQILTYETTNKDGYRIYRSNSQV